MKNILLALGLAATLSGCSKKSDDPAAAVDPFLGHWKAESLRSLVYNTDGSVKTDQTQATASELDVTATTITFTSTVSGKVSKEVDTYTRNGEQLTVTPPSGNTAGETYFARSLNANSFTFEFNGKKEAGKTYYIQSIPYHR